MFQNCKAPHKKNQGAAGLRPLPENELGGFEMNCTACHLDREKHSKDMWKLHQEPQPCAFCNKSSDKHSERLWEIHTSVVVKGRYCNVHKKIEKLYPITIGLARTGVARVCKTNADPPHNVTLTPIYMSCAKCGLYLGSIEEDNADLLDGMCLKCFRDATDQPGDWCDRATVSAKTDQIDIEERHSKCTLINIPEEEKNGRL